MFYSATKYSGRKGSYTQALLFACLSLCLLVWSGLTFAANPEVPNLSYVQNDTTPLEIGKNMLYIKDEAQTLSTEQVLASPDLQWRTINKASPNFGFTDAAYWFRFNLINEEVKYRKVLIELPIAFLDSVRLYRFSDLGILERHYVGDERPFDERPIEHQKFLMPFDLQPGLNQFLMRIQSSGTVEAPLSVWAPDAFLVADGNDRLMQGIWFGVLGIMVIYKFFMLLLLRDTTYLHYAGFTLSYLLFQAALKGYGFAYIWPTQLEWNSFSISVFIASANFFGFMFLLTLLDLPQHNPKVGRVVSVIAGVCAVLVLLSLIVPYNLTVRINSAMAMVTCIAALVVGYWSWYTGNSMAKYFCLAWTSAFTGVAILIGTKFGVMPANFWTNNAGQIGVMIQVSLFSFALAHRFNREKEMRIRAQQASLESERIARRSKEELLVAEAYAKEKLEQKVSERTLNLQQALSQLEKANKKLEIMSTTDALTKLFNRRHFETSFATEFKRSSRHKRQLSVILCDIDHFKSINDQHGHQAGDECLQKVAEIFNERITRSGDVTARYGGEEFIILLSDTSMHQAKIIAEDLRLSIEELKFEFNSKAIPVTASFGVSTLKSRNTQRADQLITQADTALYQAKNSGRNQVVCWQDEATSEGSNITSIEA